MVVRRWRDPCIPVAARYVFSRVLLFVMMIISLLYWTNTKDMCGYDVNKQVLFFL